MKTAGGRIGSRTYSTTIVGAAASRGMEPTPQTAAMLHNSVNIIQLIR